jgi:hypothetical protein
MLGLGVALVLYASSPGEATTITNVTVTIGTYTYTQGTCATTPTSTCSGWDLPVILLPGEDLVLTQNFQGAPTSTTSYNFDTSDEPNTTDPLFPTISVTADGITTLFNDLNQVLNVKSQGAVSFDANEAQVYGLPLSGPGYQLFLAYADNVHPGVCGAYASSIGLLGSPTCFPSPLFGAAYFQGTGAFVPTDPVIIEPDDGFHCDSGQATCYDAGVIRIVATPAAVPEPATMATLITGLVGLGARRYRQRKGARPNP